MAQYIFKDKLTKWVCKLFQNDLVSFEFISDQLDFLQLKNFKLDLNGLLIEACSLKNPDNLIKKLIKIGADLDSKSSFNSTPIMFMIETDNFEMVKYLLELEPNLALRNDMNKDVFCYAKVSKNKEIVLLFEKLSSARSKKIYEFYKIEENKENQPYEELVEKNKKLEEQVNILMKSMELKQESPELKRKKLKTVERII
ncbi:Hypothetical protein KVN_LOCUS109 [uncultured virus]|nr:Hypothetical protein KVN_LOCUS109 [uncultured virus]